MVHGLNAMSLSSINSVAWKKKPIVARAHNIYFLYYQLLIVDLMLKIATVADTGGHNEIPPERVLALN